MPEMIPRRTSRLPTLPGQSQLPLASLCYSILSFFPRQSRLVLGFAVAGILGAPPMVLFRVLTVVVFLLVISFGLLFLMVVWLLEDLIIAIDVAAVITKMTSKTPLQ